MGGYNPNKLTFGNIGTSPYSYSPSNPLSFGAYTGVPSATSLGSIGVDASAYSIPSDRVNPTVQVGVDPLSRLGVNATQVNSVPVTATAPAVAANAVTPSVGVDQVTKDATEPQSFLSRIGGMDSLLTGLQTLGGLYFANKNYGLLKDELAFNKRAFETNLANSQKNYNTALEDRARARAAFAGESEDSVQQYVNKHKL